MFSIQVLIAQKNNPLQKDLNQVFASEPGFQIVGKAGNWEEALHLIDQHHPDLVLVDLDLSGRNAVVTTSEILIANPRAKILVLTRSSDDRRVEDALEAGAVGYLSEETHPNEMVEIVRSFYGDQQHPSHLLSDHASIAYQNPSIERFNENLAFLQGLLEITSVAIICVNEDQDITLFSKGSSLIFGYSQEEIIGKPLSTLIPDRFHQAHEHHFSDFIESEVDTLLMNQGHLVFGQRRNGEIFPAQASVARYQSEGELVLTVILNDISKQSRMEEKLLKLSVVVEQTPASVLITDTRGTIEYVNPAFEFLSGYTADEIIGQNPRILKSGLMSDELYQSMWGTISKGEIWKGEICNRKKNGDLYWELGTVSPIRNKDGKITNYISVKEDISERKQNEDELNRYRQHLEELVEMRTAELRQEVEKHKLTVLTLREKEQTLNLALRTGQLGTWEYDFKNDKIVLSEEASIILGLDPQETHIAFDQVMDMVHPDDQVMVQGALDDAIQTCQPLNIDHRIISVSGEERTINLTIVPVFGNEQDPDKMVGTVQDITERMRIKAELLEKERLSNELSIARQIQLGMLPESTPSVEGWQFAVFYRAARQVGGDFYDFIELPEEKMGLVIADVSGKGVPAALNMALSRAIVRYSAQTTRNPAEALVRSNQNLYKYYQDNGFLTILFANLDPASGELEIANAGHCYPFRYSSSDHRTWIEKTHGIILGIYPEIQLDPIHVTLEPGDSILFYTDGFTEAMDYRGEFFEESYLSEIFTGSSHLSAAGILENIVKVWEEFVGELPQEDDLTLVVVKRDP